jgi:hypothetical protein
MVGNSTIAPNSVSEGRTMQTVRIVVLPSASAIDIGLFVDYAKELADNYGAFCYERESKVAGETILEITGTERQEVRPTLTESEYQTLQLLLRRAKIIKS